MVFMTYTGSSQNPPWRASYTCRVQGQHTLRFVVCSALNEGRSLTHLVLIMTVVNIPNTSESADFREVHLFVMFGIVDLASVIIALTEASRYSGTRTCVTYFAEGVFF